MASTVETTPVGSFLAGVGASFFLKLTTSVDDLVWFSPFLALSTSTPQRIRYCSVYVCVCVLVAAAALCLARAAELGFALAAGAIAGEDGGDAFTDGEPGSASASSGGFWDASRALRVLASAVVFIYALVELRGWISEGNKLPCLKRACSAGCLSGGDDAASSPGRGEGMDLHIEFRAIEDSNPMEYSAEDAERGDRAGEAANRIAPTRMERGNSNVEAAMMNEEVPDRSSKCDDGADDEDEEVQATIRAASKSTFALFTVALCGTIDDMILFAAVVAGRGIPWTSVLPGSVLAALVVLAVCWHISLYEPFANFVRRVPMWVLLGAISLYLLVGVFL